MRKTLPILALLFFIAAVAYGAADVAAIVMDKLDGSFYVCVRVKEIETSYCRYVPIADWDKDEKRVTAEIAQYMRDEEAKRIAPKPQSEAPKTESAEMSDAEVAAKLAEKSN